MALPIDFEFDLFLSHSSGDKAVVRSIAERLRGDGLRVWFDEWEIKPGDSIPAKIEEGLERSRVLVLCMSAHAFGSDWAELEAATFRFRDPLNKERRFIPLRLDDAPIKGSLAQFLYINWLLPDREQEYSKLLEACRPMANQSEAEPSLTSNRRNDRFPAEVRGMVREAARREMTGDVWGAEKWYIDAAQTLENSGLGDSRQIADLQTQARVNHQLGEQLRIEYRGSPGPTLLKVFDESNQLQGTATKLEVHSAGLIHHSALLLVRDHDGKAIYYRRGPRQTYANKLDFLGGHTADVDSCPRDTARREANEELQLFLNDRRLSIADEWIHQIGDEYQFVWHAPQDRERSTLFVVNLPNHRALKLRLTDEAADGIQLVEIPNYETALFQDLANAYRSGDKEFAHGAERVFIEYDRDSDVKRQIDSWFRTTDSAFS